MQGPVVRVGKVPPRQVHMRCARHSTCKPGSHALWDPFLLQTVSQQQSAPVYGSMLTPSAHAAGGGQYSLALQGLLACARWPAIMCTHPQEAHVREDNTGSGASRAVAPSCTWCEVGTNSGWTPVFHCKAPFCASLPLALYTYTPHMAWAACFTHIPVHGMPCG